MDGVMSAEGQEAVVPGGGTTKDSKDEAKGSGPEIDPIELKGRLKVAIRKSLDASLLKVTECCFMNVTPHQMNALRGFIEIADLDWENVTQSQCESLADVLWDAFRKAGTEEEVQGIADMQNS